MEMDFLWMGVSLVIGAVGLGLFLYGKRQSRFVPMIGGLAMMAYPYFVPNPLVMVGIGVAIGGFVWFMR